MLARVPSAAEARRRGYDREAVFGSAWTDVDRNGRDTRNDILSRDLTAMTRRGACKVLAGSSAPAHRPDETYRGSGGLSRSTTSFRCPLAWQLWCRAWEQDRRVRFANDPANLLAVEGRANQQKRDSGPDSWLPSNKAYRAPTSSGSRG